jgi:chemotaxis response regulator CheB
MTIRVLIADDQSMVRAGFRMLLSGEPDIEVAAEARNGLEAVATAARFKPTVILMDIRMPELDGLEARRIIAADDTARILILTTFGLDEYVYEALCAGRAGRAHRARARHPPAHRSRPIQLRDRSAAVHQRDNRQDTRHAHSRQARPPRSRPGRHTRLPGQAVRETHDKWVGVAVAEPGRARVRAAEWTDVFRRLL